MTILKRAAQVYGGGSGRPIAIASAALSGCGSSNGEHDDGGRPPTPRRRPPTPRRSTEPTRPRLTRRASVSTVDNRYFPLTPASVSRAQGVAENGTTPQVDRVAVTNQTKTILGVDTVVVLDTISSQGQPVERTHDGTPRMRRANVWYFGEDSFDYENGHFVKNSGSWQAGVNGAQPGIIMEANPKPGRRLPSGVLPRPRARPGQGPANPRSGGRPLQVVPPHSRDDRAHLPGARHQGEEVVCAGHWRDQERRRQRKPTSSSSSSA